MGVHSSKGKCYNVKPMAYYFYVKTKISVDFQVCITVPLRGSGFNLTGCDSWFTMRLWIFTTEFSMGFQCIDSFHIVHNGANLFFFKKSYSRISEKQDQISINLTNVFDFVD